MAMCLFFLVVLCFVSFRLLCVCVCCLKILGPELVDGTIRGFMSRHCEVVLFWRQSRGNTPLKGPSFDISR